MGMFLALTSVINRSKKEVLNSLNNYLTGQNGGLESTDATNGYPDFCTVDDVNGNVTVLYPGGFLEWDECAEHISKELSATVFSFHVHDGDFWMYLMFVNGEVKDQFLPIPDYWDETISDEEINGWKGNAETVSKFVPGVFAENISAYLVRWDMEREDDIKAYADDENMQGDWQLADFMKKLNLRFPLDDDGKPYGDVFKFWTKELPLKLERIETGTVSEIKTNRPKPWWKFW